MGLTLPVTEIHHQKGAYDSLYMDDVCPMKVFDAKEKCQYIQYDESIIQVDGSWWIFLLNIRDFSIIIPFCVGSRGSLQQNSKN